MKKITSLLLTFLMLMSLSIFALGADLSDGVYEVPVVLMHKEDEEESFGNKYVAQTALLKVENGEKTITILLTTNMKGIEFSYYIDGSLSGDVAKGTSVSNVTVGAETYEQGFEIPVAADGDIGLQFSVPVMPMSPSARLRIDYTKAVKVSSPDTTDAPESEATAAPTEPVTELPVTEEAATEQDTATTVTDAPPSVPTTVLVTQAAVTYEEATVTETTEAEEENDEKEIPSIVFILMFVAATVALTLLFTCDSREDETDDDK